MLAILVIPLVLALIGQGEFMLAIRSGYTSMLTSGFIVPALTIGILYSCLYIFGSRIYLNNRENTFCIPINRCASLLAGVTTAVLLSISLEGQFYTNVQLIGAIILIMAIFALSTPQLIEMLRIQLSKNQRTYVFVCPGNTGRSPMAQAICTEKMISYFDTQENMNTSGRNGKKKKNIKILSAAISGEPGIPMHSDALYALRELEYSLTNHSSKHISAMSIKSIDKIWCMSSEHKSQILEIIPEAEGKVYCLDSKNEIPVPHGKGLNAYVECAKKLEQLIDGLIKKKEIELSW